MRDQARAGADIENVMSALGRRDLDQPGGYAAVQATGPGVVVRRDLVEEVDQVVDHLICGVRVHYGRRGTPETARRDPRIRAALLSPALRSTLIGC